MGLLKTIWGFFNFMAILKWIFIIGLLSVVLGIVGSCAFKSQIKNFELGHQLKTEHRQNAKAIVKSQKKSADIERHVQQGKAQAERIREAAAKRINTQKEKANETRASIPNTDYSVPAVDYRLDVGTVRLLNAARQGAPMESAGGSDATLAAPSTVGVGQLVDNDLKIVEMYRDLATRHDALVDSVEKHLRDQAN